jgi:YVTN family beta-propeller protein
MKKLKLLFLLLPALLAAQWLETTINVGQGPLALGYNPADNKVYCANFYSNDITVINGATNQVITTIPVLSGPWTFTYNTLNNKVYCVNWGACRVTIIDGANNSVIANVLVGSVPSDLLYNSINNQIYCSNWGSNSISVIDGATNRVVATIPVGDGPAAIDYNPTTNKVYCTNEYSDDMKVIYGPTNQVIRTIQVGDAPWNLLYTPNNKIYVANHGSRNISIFDAVTHSFLGRVPIGQVGIGYSTLTYNPINNKVYCANAGPCGPYTDSTVTIIDGATNTIIANVIVGIGPREVFYNANTNNIYVANFHSKTVSVIDGITNQVKKTIAVDSGSLALAHNPIQHRIYVANFYDNTVSVIQDANSNTDISESRMQNIKIFEIYPNPAKSFFVVRLPLSATASQIKIFDISGKVVKKLKSLGVGELRVPLKDIKAGIYFVQVDNVSGIKKLVITK